MKKFWRKLVVCVSVFLICFIFVPYTDAIAQEKAVHELEEIVVTTTGKMKALDTPASISIITARELEEMGVNNIMEALEKIPGIINKSSSNDKLVVRGMDGGMAGNVVVLIDGVPQRFGDSFHNNLSSIPPSEIEKIEVLRSAGIAYGPGSSKGVISIITKKGKRDKPVYFTASGSYGSWNTYNLNTGVSGGINKWDYFINAADYHTDGYVDDKKENQDSVLLKAGYNLSDKTRIGISGNFMNYDRDSAYGLWRYKWQLDNYRRDIHFPKSETDPDLVWHNEKENDTQIYALQVSHKDIKYSITSVLSYSNFDETYKNQKALYTSSSSSRVYTEDSDQDTINFSLSGNYNFIFETVNYILSTGIVYDDIDFKNKRNYRFDPSRDTGKYDIDVGEKQYGLFWDNDFLFGKKWALKIGARIDEVEVDYKDKASLTIDEDDTMVGWCIAPSYHLNEKGIIYISAGRNFWFPTPQYYAWAAAKGSPNNKPEDLKPEKILTYEIGYKHLFHKAFNINLTGYYIDYDDKFAGLYEDDDWMGYKNIGKAEIQGIELELDGRVCSFFGYRFSGTYMNHEWKDGEVRVYDHPSNERVIRELDGKKIHGIPDYSFIVGLDFYPVERLKCRIDINTAGSYNIDYMNRFKYGSKTTVDATISYVWEKWKFWLLGKNIFDEDVERAYNSTGRLTEANGELQTSYYVQDGAYVEGGVSYQF